MGQPIDDTPTLLFVKGGNAQVHCLDGWSAPESAETWSVGTSSSIRLPVAARGCDHVLIFAVRPHVNDKGLRRQRLGIVANGKRLAEFSLGSRTTRACIIPAAVIGGEPAVRLVFATPDAAAPKSFGGSDDRVLAVAFERLVFRPEVAAPGAPATEGELDVDGVVAVGQMPASTLMMQFESLGQNCEFGLVQRHFEAEPLGIFRFSSTPLPQLLLALERRLEGLGELGSVSVSTSSNGRELMVKDTTYGFLYHAWVKAGEQTIEAVEQRERRRLPFLKRKLLDDLSLGEKVFVFHAMRAMPEEEVFALAALLRCYGPNTLLFVTLANDAHPPGTVERRSPGFLVGYIDRFAPPSNAAGASYSAWVQICRQALMLVRAGA